MTALTADRYGGVEVLDLREIEAPTPGPRDILVRVQAAAANPADLHLLAGQPFFVRFMGNGLFRPKHRVLGSDVAGHVEAVGSDVTRFRPGDAVYANLSDVGRGAFAELVAAPERVWATKPQAIDFASAAAVPMAGVTALQGLRDHGGLAPGMRVLVNGASGGVGGFAVQIAKAHGAEVTGVASARNLEAVRALGADRVIDYARDDFTAAGDVYDLVFDTVADRTVEAYRRALAPEGAFVTTGFLPALAMPRLGRARAGGPRMTNMMSTPKAEDLDVLSELIEDGRVTPRIDRSFPLGEAADALRYLSEGRARGKVVIIM
jgi:NADPH:quinone reductase-like Zn-dependent oxidoreductase